MPTSSDSRGNIGIRAVVFDLDGVLIDSEQTWDAARRAVVATVGGQWQNGATTSMMGMSAPEWSRFMVQVLNVPLCPNAIIDRVISHVLDEYATTLPLMPAADQVVRGLADVWPLAIASAANRRVIDFVLAQSGLANFFKATVSAEDVAAGKPAPDVYLAAAAALRIPAAWTAAVEDSENGLRSAVAAGMQVIAIPNRHFPPSAATLRLASLQLESLDELTSDRVVRLGRNLQQPTGP